MDYHVIVAEDEELLLQNLIKKIKLSDTNFEVSGAAQTGEQAYALVEKYNPDLVISDIRMPVMDGITLLKKVKEYFPNTDFILASGYADFKYAQSAIEYQATAYLLKPIDSDALKTVLLKLRNKYLATQNNYQSIFNQSIANNTPACIAELLRNYLIQNYDSNINLNLIAYNMNYSAGYLTKIFVSQYDCSPSKYLIQLRMQKAQQLLLHNQHLSIRQIGDMIGYHDQAYFSRIFKKYCEISPAEYREKEMIPS